MSRPMSADFDRLYKWSTINLWAEDISKILLRFGFSFLFIGGQGCPQI
jgi:hypothetical protein